MDYDSPVFARNTTNIVNKLATKNNDMRQRRVVNAANAIDDQDYITKYDLTHNLAPSAYLDTTLANNITSGELPNIVIPKPSITALGGIYAVNKVASQFIQYIDINGRPQLAQPAAGDISGLAPSATIDTTNASNITSGTLAPARLPTNVLPVSNQVNLGMVLGNTYQNTTGKTLFATIGIYWNVAAGVNHEVDILVENNPVPGGLVGKCFWVAATGAQAVLSLFFIVPINWYYRTAEVAGTGANLNYSVGWY